MNEEQFRHNVKEVLRARDVWHYVSYNPLNKGIPDLHFIASGQPYWLELKYTERPPSLDHPVSAPQIETLQHISESGGSAAVLTGTPDQVLLTNASDFDIETCHTLPSFFCEPDIESHIEWLLTSSMDGST
ncbi:MAG: hypothetical protein ABEN55_02525 [Bradymonadaceae bacterium]